MGSGWFFDEGARSAVRAGRFRARASARAAENLAQFIGHIVVHRTGVSLFLGDAKFREFVDQFVSFDLQLPRQHINADLIHRVMRFLACSAFLALFGRLFRPPALRALPGIFYRIRLASGRLNVWFTFQGFGGHFRCLRGFGSLTLGGWLFRVQLLQSQSGLLDGFGRRLSRALLGIFSGLKLAVIIVDCKLDLFDQRLSDSGNFFELLGRHVAQFLDG
jgi:hypothetical protein